MFKIVQTNEDIKTLVSIANLIWHEHYSTINSIDCIEYMLEKFQSVAAISSQIANECYEYYFIISADEIIGYVGIQPQKNELFLSKLYLDKEFRGKGVGRKTLKFVVGKAKEKGFNRIFLTVNKKNYSSIEFYQHMGFKIVESVVTDIGDGYVMDDYIMKIDINRGWRSNLLISKK